MNGGYGSRSDIRYGRASTGITQIRDACMKYYCITMTFCVVCFFFSSRRRHTRYIGDWSSDVCSSDLSQKIPRRSPDQIRRHPAAFHPRAAPPAFPAQSRRIESVSFQERSLWREFTNDRRKKEPTFENALARSRVFHSQCALRRSGLTMRGGFHAAKHLVEFGAIEISAVHDDTGDLLRVGNVIERIGRKQQEVRELPFFHRA